MENSRRWSPELDGIADAGGCRHRHILAHRTRFGNQVYAIGGNATSANLMGISTRSTTIRIYMLSTGLATLAGIVFSIYTGRAMLWRALASNWMR